MAEKEEPLELILQRRPSNADKAVNGGLAILQEVLKNLNYNGKWQVAFKNQNGKKKDRRFQVARINDPRSILVRTKPGDSSTSWDVILYPPKQYKLETVFSGFQRVHVRDLSVRSAGLGPVKILTSHEARNEDLYKGVIPDSVIRHFKEAAAVVGLEESVRLAGEEKKKKLVLAKLYLERVLPDWGDIDEEVVRNGAKRTDIEMPVLDRVAREMGVIIENNHWKKAHQVPIPQETLLHSPKELIQESLDEVEAEVKKRLTGPEIEKPKPKSKLKVEEADNPYKLSPDTSIPLSENDEACDKALASIGISMARNYAQNELNDEILESGEVFLVPLQMSEEFLFIPNMAGIFEMYLELPYYVEHQSHYSVTSRAAASLLKGLGRQHYLERVPCPSDSAHTKGYNLLPNGIKRLKELAIQNFSDLACWREPGQAKVKTSFQEEPLALTELEKLKKNVSDNLDLLKTLESDFTKGKTSVQTFAEMAVELAADLRLKKAAAKGLQVEIEELKVKLQPLERDLETVVNDILQLEKDIVEAEESQKNEQTHLDQIAVKIKKICENSHERRTL